MTPRRSDLSLPVWVWTFMPSATGVVHEAGVPARPSISTRHRRQEPKACSVSVAQSLGMEMPASAAARITEVPAATSTGMPSISILTRWAERDGGVPRSRSMMALMAFGNPAGSDAPHS